MSDTAENRSLFYKLLKFAFLFFAFAWLAAQTAIFFIPFEQVTSFLQNVTGINFLGLSIPVPSAGENIQDQIYITLFGYFYVFSFFSAIVGTIIFSKGRSFTEGMAIFVAFALPKMRKYWGVVLDKQDGTPIPFASVRVYEKAGNTSRLIAQTVSDLDGRYRIRLSKKPDEGNLESQASGYIVLNKKLSMTVTPLGTKEVLEDLPMDKSVSIKSSFKAFFNAARPRLYTFLVYYLYTICLVALLFSLYGVFVYGAFATMFFVLLYGGGFIWNTYVLWQRYYVKGGKVVDSESKMGIKNVSVKFFDKTGQKVSIMTNEDGIVKVNLLPGQYSIRLNKEGYISIDSDGNQIEAVDVIVNKNGYIDKNVLLKLVAENIKENPEGTTLMNPFS